MQQTGDVASSSILHAAFLFIIKLPLMLTEEHSSAHQNVRLYVLQGKPLLGVKKNNNKKGGGVASKRCRETLELSGKKAVNELLAIQNTSSGL